MVGVLVKIIGNISMLTLFHLPQRIYFKQHIWFSVPMLMVNADQLLLSRRVCNFVINCAGVWGMMYHSTSMGIL